MRRLSVLHLGMFTLVVPFQTNAKEHLSDRPAPVTDRIGCLELAAEHDMPTWDASTVRNRLMLKRIDSSASGGGS